MVDNQTPFEYQLETPMVLTGSLAGLAFDAVDGFHDAFLKGVQMEGLNASLEILRPYFVRERQYGAAGIKSALLHLEVIELSYSKGPLVVSDLQEREIYSIVRDVEQGTLVFDLDELFDVRFRVNMSRSTLTWFVADRIPGLEIGER